MTQDQNSGVGRRDFMASVTAGIAAAAASADGAGVDVVETDVEIKTPDGICDAAFIHPKSGSHPGVLIWPDAFGLRPSMREMAKRLAAEGYSVLVPNPFYRVAQGSCSRTPPTSTSRIRTSAKLQPLMGSVNAPGAIRRRTRSRTSPSSTRKRK